MWVNPYGVEIRSEMRDGLLVKYGVMVIGLGLNVSENMKPLSGIYTCDARFEGSSNGRNQVYVGIYNTGGKLSCAISLCSNTVLLYKEMS